MKDMATENKRLLCGVVQALKILLTIDLTSLV